MSSNPENLIQGLPRRPRIGDASASTILGAIVGGLLTGGWGGALIGSAAGNILANQRQPLEMSIREHFKKNHLDVIFFQRAPRSVKITFSYRPSAFWTVESVLPDHLNMSPEDADDWLYGNLITNVLPQTLHQINSFTSR